MSNDVWKDFAAQEVSHSMAHYLTSIHALLARNGYARVSDVARELDVTKGSASVQVKHLKEKGFVAEDDNRHLHLTESGSSVAQQVMYTREVLIRFLSRVLEVDEDVAESDACKIEHLLSPETCNGIHALVRLLDTDEDVAESLRRKYREFRLDCPSVEECTVCEEVCMAKALQCQRRSGAVSSAGSDGESSASSSSSTSARG